MILFIATIAINTIGAWGVINGSSQAAVSAQFPTMITPAGFAFSIWGVIYSLLGIGLGWALFGGKDNQCRKNLLIIAPLFWLSCIVNMSWIVVFSYKIIWLSAVLIVFMWLSVFAIVVRLEKVQPAKQNLYKLGFGLYGGWLSIATVVNFAAWLTAIQFQFWHQESLFYAVILSIFLLVVLALQRIYRNVFFNLPIAWAFFGIINKLSYADNQLLFVVLIGGILLLLLSSAWTYWQSNTSRQ